MGVVGYGGGNFRMDEATITMQVDKYGRMCIPKRVFIAMGLEGGELVEVIITVRDRQGGSSA